MIDSETLYRWRELVMDAADHIVVHGRCKTNPMQCDIDTDDKREELDALADEMLEHYLDALRRETSVA